MSKTVIMPKCYDKRSTYARGITKVGFELSVRRRQPAGMLSHDELLAALERLKAGGVTNADLARTLDLPSSRIAEIFDKGRKIKLDEAKALVEHYDLEGPPLPLMSEQVAMEFVRHCAAALGVEPTEDQKLMLAADLAGFVAFAMRPAVRQALQDARDYFLGRPLAPSSKERR